MNTIEQRLKTKKWEAILDELSNKGFATVPDLINDKECAELLREFKEEYRYRKTVVMERYRFGRGVYKYFNYPLPNILTELRETFYGYLAPVANKWMEVLKVKLRYPDTHQEFIKQCKENGQEKTTALILGYGAGGFCAMHQDLYGEVYFPMQIVLFLDDTDKDYTGGEFILTENIPMAQSRYHLSRCQILTKLFYLHCKMKSNRELAREIIKWIDENDYETYSISIGHDRNGNSYAIAEELAENWQNTQTWVRVVGGYIILHVDWPEAAASWFAQAKELNKDRPDAVAIISSASSGIAVLKRLADQESWSASRTFFLLHDTKTLLKHTVDLIAYEGLKCMTEDGARWIVINSSLQQIQ